MKQKKQLVVLVVLLLIAGGIWFLYLDHARPVVTADAGSAIQNPKLLSVENPQLHNAGVDRARRTEYRRSHSPTSAIPRLHRLRRHLLLRRRYLLSR